MQKQQSRSGKHRSRVKRGRRSGEKAPATRRSRDLDFVVLEPVVRTARPIQLEEADWVLDECTTWPVDEEAHPRATKARSGTLSTDPDGERIPVVEPGLSIYPEDFGRQFLRDATEQDNFESALEASDIDFSATALEQVISEASLEASAQAGFSLPESGALGGSNGRERPLEPRTRVLDLTSPVVREASLFDQPTEEGDTRPPVIITEGRRHLNGARHEQEVELELDLERPNKR